MIRASEAKANVTAYESHRFHAVEMKVNELLETMSKSIEYHSKNGITKLEFMPYENSRFPSYDEKEIASRIFLSIFQNNGYSVARNSWSDNILEIRW